MLVTGATGFLGTHVCRALAARGLTVRALTRQPNAPLPGGIMPAVVRDLTDAVGLAAALDGVSTVVHLAGYVHQPRAHTDELACRAVNVGGTRVVLQAAVAAGVRTFLFTSTVKAVGDQSREPWTERTPAAPADAYGRTKLEAEQLVRAVAGRHGLHAPILRLPLVYGPGMKANALRLFDLVDRGVPLPLGRVENQRSSLYVGNFLAAMTCVVEHAAGDDLFFVSDGSPVSTPQLVRAIARALGRPARLVPVPLGLMRLGARLADVLALAVPSLPDGSAIMDRLAGSLAVDTSKLTAAVGYRPPYTLEQGLAATAEWYRGRVRR